jgi:hypothetical protein
MTLIILSYLYEVDEKKETAKYGVIKPYQF